MRFTELQDAGEAEDKVRIRKSTLKRIISEAARTLTESHPYDVSINNAVDVGFFSNSDAVEEVQSHLEAAGASDLADEIDTLVQYGDDDIYDILDMIPREIKDKLPIG